MSEENNEDDSWLYGSSNENQESQEELPQNDEKPITDEQSALPYSNETTQEDGRTKEFHDDTHEEFNQADSYLVDTSVGTEKVNGSSNVNGSISEKNENDNEESDDDDDEDDIVVTIGDIQPASSFNIKQRGNLLAPATTTGQDKPKANLGKFSIEEFESVGTISGQSSIEYNIEAIEDKPWRKPGADITDYFNYGFNEETWRAYCERQKRMRHESGAGLSGLGPNPPQTAPANNNPNRTLTSLTTSENSKYSTPGLINSHSGPQNFSNRGFNSTPVAPAKENVIQVMTAERREYSRPKGKFDASMSMPPPSFNMANEPFYPEDSYNYGYEPTQEQQWNNDNVSVGWMPSGIKELTPGPPMMNMPGPPHMNMSMPPPNAMLNMPPNIMNVPPQMVPPPQHNMSMGIGPPGMPPMMPPPVINPSISQNRGNEDHRNNQQMDKRNDSAPPGWRSRDTRDKERDYRERDREEESPADRERRRERDRYRSDRDSRGSSRRDRSRSRERSRRRSKSRSRERERKSRDKKKSHKKDKDDSD